MAKKKAAVTSTWLTPRFQGKSVFFTGRFEKYGRTCRDYLGRYVLSEGGSIADSLTAEVTYLVMREPTGSSTHEQKAAKLNAKGASISVITDQQLHDLFMPTNDEVAEMLAAGEKGHARLTEWLSHGNLDSESYRYQPPPYAVRDASWKGADLQKVPLWCACLENADLRETNATTNKQRTESYSFGPLVDCKLDGASLDAWFDSLTNCSCRNADLSGSWLNFYHDQKCSADFRGAKLVRFHFSEADLTGSNFEKADLTDADLEDVTAESLCFSNTCLANANCKEGKFTGSDFTKADLSGANLIDANLERCNLTGANLRGAVLTGASLKGACLKGADFSDANVGQVNFDGADLTKVKGLTISTQKRTIGPKLKELSDRLKQATAFQTTINVATKKHPIRLVVRAGGYRGNQAGWTKDLDGYVLTEWDQATNSVADSFHAAVGSWPDSTPLPNTVTAEGKKTGLVSKKLQQLALEAWCETFGIAVPTDEEMKQLGQHAEILKNNERDRLLALLDQPDRVERWSAACSELVDVSFPNSNLAGKQLDGLFLGDLEFEDSNFEGASLVGAELKFSAYRRSNFRGANLSRLVATWSKFDECDFCEANLTDADFQHASLVRANFSNANLSNTNLCEANLRGTNLMGAKFLNDEQALGWSMARAEFDETTVFPANFKLPESMIWKGKDIDPRLKNAVQAIQAAGPIDLPQFMTLLEALVDKDRIKKATSMLKAERFRLFAQAADDHLVGVVKSQNDPDLVYSCRLTKDGEFACCTQNLNVCGGLRGALCKHLLVLIIGMTNGGELDPNVVNQWIMASRFKKPALDKDAMSETLLRYKGAEAGEVDWRPMETIPEDYYAL